MKDNVLKDMDFFNHCGDIVEQWLNDNDDYLIWINDEIFNGRDELMRNLSVPDNAVHMEMYIVISKKDEVSLSIAYQDENENDLGEQEYLLGENDNAYMLDELCKAGILTDRKQAIKENREYEIDNR